jgi:hypothetical protein
MADSRYQARGPENRTTLITVRVTADDRELLQRLAGERGETVSRMLLAPWLGAAVRKRPTFARRSGESVEEPVAVTRRVEPAQPGIAAAADVDQAKATPIDVREPGTVEPAPAAVSDETPIPPAAPAKRLRRPRVNPEQEALLLSDPRVER